MALFTGLGKFNDFGLFVIRIGVGVMMMVHGIPKIEGGPDLWVKIGGAITNIGIHEYYTFWGFMASLAEGVGGLLVILGLAFRPACFFLLFTMFIAASSHLTKGENLTSASHAVELAFLFFGLFFIGPGKLSVDKS